MSTSNSPLAKYPSPDTQIFQEWLLDRGIIRHRGIRLQLADDGSGWGIWATEDISRGQILCAVPRQSILSPRTASLQLPYEPESASDIVLHLSACLLHELRLGKESKWFGWLQNIPRETVPLPTLWGEKSVGGDEGSRALEWLEGTEAQKELKRKNVEGLSLEDLRQYYNTLRLPPTTDYPLCPNFASFLYAYSMVSSRGFALDTYHLIGLIPFCDMFNHSSTSPNTSLSIDSNVCETCGSLLQCQHDENERPDRLANLSNEYLIQLEKDGMADMVDMRVQKDIKKDQQVFSCYDEDHGDAELLVEYGFIEGRGDTLKLSWTYREVLSRDGADFFMRYVDGITDPDIVEDEAEAISNTNTTIPPNDQSDLSADVLAPDSHISHSQTPLIGPPRGREKLIIKSNGEISRTLLLALFSSLDIPSSSEEKINLFQHSVKSIETGKMLNEPKERNVANRVCELFEEKLMGYRWDMSSLGDMDTFVKGLDPDYKLEKLAAEVMIAERKAVQDCLYRWRQVARWEGSPPVMHQ